MQFINSTAIVPRTRKVITKMANPIADSAAATVGTNEANDWPIISSKETENTKKFKLTANNIDSIGIDIIGIFRLLRRIPQIPKIEMIIEKVKYFIGSVSETWNVREIQIMWGLESVIESRESFSSYSLSGSSYPFSFSNNAFDFLPYTKFHLSLADHIQGISSEYILSFHLCSPMHSQYYSLTSLRRGISLPP